MSRAARLAAWWLIWAWGMGNTYDLGGVAGPFASKAACETIAKAYQALAGDLMATAKNAGRLDVTYANRCEDDRGPGAEFRR